MKQIFGQENKDEKKIVLSYIIFLHIETIWVIAVYHFNGKEVTE
jgi:hypothetical protein